MEISQKFAEQQMLLHKTEFEKWKKIYESFGEKPKRKGLTKKEQDILISNKIEAYKYYTHVMTVEKYSSVPFYALTDTYICA